MADNVELNAGSGGALVASDEVTYSGDTTKVQIVRLVHVAGSEGSKTLSEIADATNGLDVDVTRSALPSGAATSARQDTGNTSLGNIEANSVIAAGAVALAAGGGSVAGYVVAVQGATGMTPLSVTPISGQTSVAAGSGSVSATTQRVVLATDVALPAGTNAIGKLAANSGVDIGDVDVTSLPALVAGTAYVGKVLPTDRDVTLHTNYAKKYYTNAGAVTDGIVWSPAAGTRWHVVSMFINLSAAGTVTFEDDKAGGDEAVMKMELAANSGMTINFGERYPLASGEDAADLLVTTSAGNVYITLTGYEI